MTDEGSRKVENVDYEDVDTVVEKIESVEIQGATSIAYAGVQVLKSLADGGAEEEEIDEAAEKLRNARPTEPFLFNAIRLARGEMGYNEVLNHIDSCRERVAENGTEVLDDVDVVYTHCHSSTVTRLLEHVDGSFEIHVTETRPLYQGRETAKELEDIGFEVEFYVDSGGLLALEDADVMLIGCDAVFDSGGCVNKIGSRMFTWIAERLDVPVYVVTDSWKYDPGPGLAGRREIESRPVDEVWKDAPDGVNVKNKAFELISPEHVTAVVSEVGVHEPDDFVNEVRAAYPEISELSGEK
ncbi:MAG: translation initiation factor eIF-2B [Halobacteria archaeon]